MMNKKGTIGLKNVFVLMILLSFTFMLIGLFVSDMANSYDNTAMSDEWAASNTSASGLNLYNQIQDDTNDMRNNTEEGVIGELISSLGNLGIVIKATGSIITGLFSAPTYIGALVSGSLESMAVPSSIADIVGITIGMFLWITVIIAIIALALRRGGSV